MSSRGARQGGMVAKQGGLATVEFAIGALLVLLLMLVSAEIGRIYFSYNTLTKAVRAGSRYLSSVALSPASVMSLDDAKAARTRNLVVTGNIEGEGAPLLEGLTVRDVEISQGGAAESASRYVQVSAAFDYRPMLGTLAGLGSGEAHRLGFEMNASSTMPVFR